MIITEPSFYLVASLAVLIVGVAKGGLGGGIGIVAVPLMAMVIGPLQAAAILLPLLMVMDVLALKAYWRQWDARYLRILIPASLVGTLIGFITAHFISADGLRALIGTVSLAYSLQYFWPHGATRNQTPRAVSGIFWGTTAGFTSFSIHAGGPPLQAYLLQHDMHRTTFQATSVLFFFALNWSKVLPYAWLGQWSPDNLLTSLILLPLAPIGVSLGRRLHERINDLIFFRVIHGSLFVIGIKLLYDASVAL